ncbi:MAG: hypothetical protein EPO02_13395 [Nitrospirae bacterium]|nr:MAG: hypothetical protein EPO02_13395 [Nitrospirota bacterium]
MTNSNPDQSGLELGKWKPGQSGNPKGRAKGSYNLSTWIQNLMNDESFEAILKYSKDVQVEYKGAPIKAIIAVAMMRAVGGDERWADWLAKHGYGSKLIVGTEDPAEAVLRKMGLMGENDAGQNKGSSETSP